MALAEMNMPGPDVQGMKTEIKRAFANGTDILCERVLNPVARAVMGSKPVAAWLDRNTAAYRSQNTELMAAYADNGTRRQAHTGTATRTAARRTGGMNYFEATVKSFEDLQAGRIARKKGLNPEQVTFTLAPAAQLGTVGMVAADYLVERAAREVRGTHWMPEHMKQPIIRGIIFSLDTLEETVINAQRALYDDDDVEEAEKDASSSGESDGDFTDLAYIGHVAVGSP